MSYALLDITNALTFSISIVICYAPIPSLPLPLPLPLPPQTIQCQRSWALWQHGSVLYVNINMQIDRPNSKILLT